MELYINYSWIDFYIILFVLSYGNALIPTTVNTQVKGFRQIRGLTLREKEKNVLKNNEIVPFASAWMDLESVILSEVIQTEKEKYHMTSLYAEPKKSWYNELIKTERDL